MGQTDGPANWCLGVAGFSKVDEIALEESGFLRIDGEGEVGLIFGVEPCKLERLAIVRSREGRSGAGKLLKIIFTVYETSNEGP